MSPAMIAVLHQLPHHIFGHVSRRLRILTQDIEGEQRYCLSRMAIPVAFENLFRSSRWIDVARFSPIRKETRFLIGQSNPSVFQWVEIRMVFERNSQNDWSYVYLRYITSRRKCQWKARVKNKVKIFFRIDISDKNANCMNQI